MDIVKVCQLYPQYYNFKPATDRRHNNPFVPTESVPYDRRSGVDRRVKERLNSNTGKDVELIKDKIITFMRLVPPLRKLISAYESSPLNKDTKESSNPLYALGMVFRFLNESEEDYHDLKDAVLGNNSMKEYQHPFWAFRGSLIDRRAEKFVNMDLTLYDFKKVKKLLKKIGITGIERQGDFIKFEGDRFAKIIARATLRFPILGAAFFAALESYGIAKAENKPKEAIKALIRIVCIMSLSAICGAIGGYQGKKLELIGMGAGIMLGAKVSEKINSQI